MDNDPQQAAVDAAVAAMVASSATILTGPSDQPVPAGDPTERVRLALARRTTLRAALDALKTRGHTNAGAIYAALANADVDGLITAFVSHALGEFLDANLGRADTFVHGLSASVEQELVAAVYADPQRALATDDNSPDGRYVRRLATEATTLDQHVFDVQGRPTRPKVPALSMMQTVVRR